MAKARPENTQTFEERMCHVKTHKRKNSRAKGARSELEARDLLRRCGITDAERGARNGVKSGADIYSPMLDRLGIRVEVKNVEKMKLGNARWIDAINQAMDDSDKTGKMFVLLWRPCRGQWAISFIETLMGVVTVTGEEAIGARFMYWLATKGGQHG